MDGRDCSCSMKVINTNRKADRGLSGDDKVKALFRVSSEALEGVLRAKFVNDVKRPFQGDTSHSLELRCKYSLRNFSIYLSCCKVD